MTDARTQEKIDFWHNVYGFKMGCIRELAMAEPLVDTVEENQIATNCCSIKTVDLNTMTKADTNFVVCSSGLHAHR